MAITSGRDKVFKLIARGTELDLFQDETIYLSNNVTGLFDIGKLPSDFTRQLTIPGTKKNNAFFQHVYDIAVDNPFLFKTNEKVIAQFDLDGFYVSQGYMQLEKVNLRENKYIESYEVSLYGLLSSFKKDLQNITLNDLGTLTKYNHLFTMGNIANSFSGSSYDGVSVNPTWDDNSIFTSSQDGHNLAGEIVYSLNDSGQQIAYQAVLPQTIFGIDNTTGPFNTSDGGDIVPQDYKPMIRLDLVIDAIFDELGYTYESTFLEESKFDNIYLFCDRGKRFPIIDGVDLETYGQIEVSPISGSSTPLVLTNNVSASLNFTNVLYDPSFSIINSSGTYSPFWGSNDQPPTSEADMFITLNIAVTGSDNTTAYPEFYFVPQFGGPNNIGLESEVDLTEITETIRRDFVRSGGEKEYTLTQQIGTGASFASGSEYNFGIGYITRGVGTVNVTIGPGGNTQSKIEIKRLKDLGQLLEIDIPSNMPFGTNGITCLDFIASVQKKFNLQIYPSKTKPRHFIIETFNNWYKQGEVKNFDKYMDLNQRISVIPANNLGVREVEFGDTLDLDFLSQNFNKENNREFGKSYFRDTQNFFSEGKLEVKSGFSSSPLRYVAGSGVTGSASGLNITSFTGAISTNLLAVCSSGFTTLYHNGAGSYPTVGDTIYYDAFGNSPITGVDFMRTNLSADVYLLDTATAEVLNDSYTTCTGGGGPTS